MITAMVDIIKGEDNFPCIIMEKRELSLDDIIQQNKEQYLLEKYIVRIFTMISVPLYWIHKMNIIHRDIKPNNILKKYIGNLEVFEITDFGIS